jgi:hypothetical protein
MHVKPAFEFRFQGGQRAGEVAGVSERGPHFQESAHHEYAHLHSPWAVEDVGRHDCAVLRESEREHARVAMLAGTGRKLRPVAFNSGGFNGLRFQGTPFIPG